VHFFRITNPQKCSNKPALLFSEIDLFNLIEELKIMGAPIRYSRTRQTYFYTTEFEIKLQYSLCFVKSNQLKQIFGGNQIKTVYSNFFRVKENNLVAG